MIFAPLFLRQPTLNANRARHGTSQRPVFWKLAIECLISFLRSLCSAPKSSENKGKLPLAFVCLQMLLFRRLNAPACVSLLTSPASLGLYLARPAQHWRRWCRVYSLPHTGTCRSPPGSAWRSAGPQPAPPHGTVPKRAGAGHEGGVQ